MASAPVEGESVDPSGSDRVVGQSFSHHFIRLGGLWLEMLTLCLLFTGYRAGTWDHLVLQVMGTHWADPGAFANDAIALSAPQPHWAFDLLVELGIRSGSLPFLYFAYFAISMLILVAGVAGVMHVLVPKAAYEAAALAVAILAASPAYLFGALNPAIGIALPAIMGTALCVAVVSAAIHDRWDLAAVAVVVVAVVHVQLAVVALGLFVLLLGAETRVKKRLLTLPAAGAVLSAFTIAAGLMARPVYGDIADFVKVCHVIIPYHCDAKSWAWEVFASAVPALIMSASIAGLAWRGFRAQRRWALVVTALLAPEIVFVVVDRLSVPVLAQLVEGSNGYRLGSVLMVVTACSFAACIARADELPGLALPVALGMLFLFLVEWSGPLYLTPGLAGGSILAGCLAGLMVRILARTSAQRTRLRSAASGVTPVRTLVACFVLCALLVAPRNTTGSAFALDNQLGRQSAMMTKLVPEGAVFIADPSWIWLRLQTRRAVVVDCKFVPFGGVPLREYFQRINAFGGWAKVCRHNGFAALSASSITSLGKRYGANYLLLRNGDPRMPDLVRDGWEKRAVLRLGPTSVQPGKAVLALLLRAAPPRPGVGASS